MDLCLGGGLHDSLLNVNFIWADILSTGSVLRMAMGGKISFVIGYPVRLVYY